MKNPKTETAKPAETSEVSPPKPKFEIGDCARGKVPGTGCGAVIFINDRIWAKELKCWRYGITYTQANMSDASKWTSGGGSFWWSEDQLENLEGIQLLWGTLWKEFRTLEELKKKIAEVESKISSIQVALNVLKPNEPSN